MVIEIEELFNHGIKGERLAGESLLAKASVTGHNFVEIETLHMAKTRILLLRVDLGTSLLACFTPFFLSFANREKTPQCTQPGMTRPVDHADHVSAPSTTMENFVILQQCCG